MRLILHAPDVDLNLLSGLWTLEMRQSANSFLPTRASAADESDPSLMETRPRASQEGQELTSWVLKTQDSTRPFFAGQGCLTWLSGGQAGMASRHTLNTSRTLSNHSILLPLFHAYIPSTDSRVPMYVLRRGHRARAGCCA